MVLADFDLSDSGRAERKTPRREQKGLGSEAGTKIRSPQDYALTPANTQRQAKKYQPENWLVF